MQQNVGNIERAIRVVIGVVVLALYFFLPGNHKYWALIGLAPLITGILAWCPPYALLGINTCRPSDQADT